MIFPWRSWAFPVDFPWNQPYTRPQTPPKPPKRSRPGDGWLAMASPKHGFSHWSSATWCNLDDFFVASPREDSEKISAWQYSHSWCENQHQVCQKWEGATKQKGTARVNLPHGASQLGELGQQIILGGMAKLSAYRKFKHTNDTVLNHAKGPFVIRFGGMLLRIPQVVQLAMVYGIRFTTYRKRPK